MMPDKVVIAGPSWLEFGLNYTESYNEDILESVEGILKHLNEK